MLHTIVGVEIRSDDGRPFTATPVYSMEKAMTITNEVKQHEEKKRTKTN